MCEDKTEWARDLIFGQETAIETLWTVFNQREFSRSKPAVVFLGGQPGCGRTTIIHRIRNSIFKGNLWKEKSLKGCDVTADNHLNKPALAILNRYHDYLHKHMSNDETQIVSTVLVLRDIECCPYLAHLLMDMQIMSMSSSQPNFSGFLLLFVVTLPWLNAPHRPKEQMGYYLQDIGIPQDDLRNATMIPLGLLHSRSGPTIVRSQLDKLSTIAEDPPISVRWQKQTERRLDDIWQVSQNGHHIQKAIDVIGERLRCVLREGFSQYLLDARVVKVDIDFSSNEFVVGQARFPTGLELTIFEPSAYIADVFHRLHESIDSLNEFHMRSAANELLYLSEVGLKMFTNMVCAVPFRLLRCSDLTNLQKILNGLSEVENRHPLLLLNLCTLYGDDRAALLFEIILSRLVPKYGIQIVKQNDIVGRSIFEYVSVRQLPRTLRLLQTFGQRQVLDENDNN